MAEYARKFPVVCGDFAFYQYPLDSYWKRLFESTPNGFLFAFKVPGDVTVLTWPKHTRYGAKAGEGHKGFLVAEILMRQPQSALRRQIGRFGLRHRVPLPQARRG